MIVSGSTGDAYKLDSTMVQSNVGCTVIVGAQKQHQVLAQTRICICRDQCDVWLTHAARDM